MNAKLTLTIEESIINKAKLFAEEQCISLSEMIENYLKAITMDSDIEVEQLSPLLSTISEGFSMSERFDYE